MPWNGSGSYAPPVASFPEVNGTVIDANRFNPTLLDVAAGITACIAKNGENAATANLPMGGFKHTGVGDALTAGQYLNFGQSGGKLQNLALEGGTGILTLIALASAVAADLSFRPGGSQRFVMTEDGRLYGTALHNNAGAVTGTTNQYIASGTYTPTFPTTTNLTGVAATSPWRWLRAGNTVIVSGGVTATRTGAGGAELAFTLPIASNFTVNEDLTGVLSAIAENDVNDSTLVYGSSANDHGRAVWNFLGTAGLRTYSVFCFYEIK